MSGFDVLFVLEDFALGVDFYARLYIVRGDSFEDGVLSVFQLSIFHLLNFILFNYVLYQKKLRKLN